MNKNWIRQTWYWRLLSEPSRTEYMCTRMYVWWKQEKNLIFELSLSRLQNNKKCARFLCSKELEVDCKAALLKTLIPLSDPMNFTHSSNEQTKRNQNHTNYQELVKYFPIKKSSHLSFLSSSTRYSNQKINKS